MKKKIFILLLSLTLVFAFIFTIPSFAQKVYAITALTEGNSNVLFSNGYRGYCIDMNKHYATVGQLFEEDDTSLATSNIDGSDISGYLKALFVIKFDYLFVSDGNGSYELDFDKKDSFLPAVIWNFSDNRYIWGEQKTIANEIKAYDGPAIPDEGYTITLDNGDVITFYFLVLHPEDTDTQDFFSYKIAVNEEETTTEETTTEETTTEETTTEETTTEETTTEETTTEETTTEETTTEETTTEESTTEETTTEETTTEESTTEESTTEESTTEESTTEETTTEETTTEETTTEESTTEESTTEESTTEPEESTTNPNGGPNSSGGGDNTGGGSVITPPGGENPDDDDPDGDNPDGNDPDGDNPNGDTPDGDTSNKDENIPDTNNCSNVGLWSVISTLSLCGMFVLVLIDTKKKVSV